MTILYSSRPYTVLADCVILCRSVVIRFDIDFLPLTLTQVSGPRHPVQSKHILFFTKIFTYWFKGKPLNLDGIMSR